MGLGNLIYEDIKDGNSMISIKTKTISAISAISILAIAFLGSQYLAEKEDLKRIKSEFYKSYLDGNRVLNLSEFSEIDFNKSSFPGVFEDIRYQGIGFDEKESDRIGTNPDATITNYKAYLLESDSVFTRGLLHIGQDVKVSVPIMFDYKIQYEGILTNCKSKIDRNDIAFLDCDGGTVKKFNINKREGFYIFRITISDKHLKRVNFERKEYSFSEWVSVYVIISNDNEMLIFNDLLKSGLEFPSITALRCGN